MACAAAAAAAAPAAGQQNADANRMTIPLSDPNRPATVDVNLFGGAITVRAYSGKEVIVTARGDRDVFRPDSRAQGLKRLTTGRISIDEANNVVTIRSGRSDSPDIEIQVPVRTNLKLRSMNEGIEVEGVDGDIEANSQNDYVTLTNVSGSVVAHSQNDDVRVTMTRVAADKPMAFSSANGDVDVTLPAGTKANVRMTTHNGDIWTGFDIQVNETGLLDRPGKSQTMTGAINGGGPDFQFRSLNGNIYIRRGN